MRRINMLCLPVRSGILPGALILLLERKTFE